MIEQQLLPVTLPAYPQCEKYTKDIHERLYRLSDKRFVLDSNGMQITMCRDEALAWLTSRGMSRATMY